MLHGWVSSAPGARPWLSGAIVLPSDTPSAPAQSDEHAGPVAVRPAAIVKTADKCHVTGSAIMPAGVGAVGEGAGVGAVGEGAAAPGCREAGRQRREGKWRASDTRRGLTPTNRGRTQPEQRSGIIIQTAGKELTRRH